MSEHPAPRLGPEPLPEDAAWQLLGDAGGHVHFVLDKFTQVRFVTPNVQGLLGFSAEEMTGRSMMDTYHAADLDRIGDGYESALYGGQLVLARHRCERADGTHVWVESTSRAVDTGNGPAILVSLRREPGNPDAAWTQA